MLNKKYLPLLAGLTTAIILGAVFFFWQSGEQQPLQLALLNVGQGDAILLETPAHHTVLIDAGPDSRVVGELGRILTYGVKHLDLVILTHPDGDHISGLPEILQRYTVGQIMLTGVLHDHPAYAEILRQITAQKIPILLADADQDLDLGSGVKLDLLWPTYSKIGEDPTDNNATSIVARLTYGQTSALLTGDADTTVEQELLKNPATLKADILKLGHHGSKTSSSKEFLTVVQPTIALVSAGKNNRYGHPNRDTLARLALTTKLLSTITDGTVVLTSDGKKWKQK
jgi:competence protein ComEC